MEIVNVHMDTETLRLACTIPEGRTVDIKMQLGTAYAIWTLNQEDDPEVIAADLGLPVKVVEYVIDLVDNLLADAEPAGN